MKKNGFIATSLLYAFFLVFISLFIVLLLNFMHNKLLVQKIDDNAKKTLSSINNLQLTDLNVGDYVKFKNETPVTGTAMPLSEEGTWIVAKKDNGNITLVSDLKAYKFKVNAALSTDNNIPRSHPMSISVFNEINDMTNPDMDLYRKSLMFKNYDSMSISIIDTKLLNELRNTEMDQNIKRALFNMNGSYVVLNSEYGDPYVNTYEYPEGNMSAYYLYNAYSFSNELNNDSTNLERLLNEYCNASSFDKDNKTISYSANNFFGYVDITSGSDKDSSGNIIENNYIDFCYYSSPVNYSHTAADLIVSDNITDQNDLITSIKSSNNTLRFRMDMEVHKDDQAHPIYIAGGKGISTDPYIVVDGVKQS